MSPQTITDKLGLEELNQGKPESEKKTWFVVPSCATTGEGLVEGLAWLSNNIKTPPTPGKK
jgi:ADP-ribosylation factor protein 6